MLNPSTPVVSTNRSIWSMVTWSGFRITGSKIFGSNGPIADVAVVYAVTDAEKGYHGGISAFLVETDSPYLSPVPLRGKRNEPANVVHTARYVAELRKQRYEDLAAASSANAVRRLRLPTDSSR